MGDVLLKTGISNYDKVSKILQKEGIIFSDGYHKPEILKMALRKAYGCNHTVVVKITKELRDFVGNKDFI